MTHGSHRRVFLGVAFLFLIAVGGADGDQLPKLRVSDNQRFLVKDDGTPFVWIGDTFWHLPYYTAEEHDHYLVRRKAQGFTILQVKLDTDVNRANVYGEKPYTDAKMQNPNEKHWEFVDSFLQKSARLGLYVAPVLSWGEPQKLGRLNDEEIHRAWKWAAMRYKDMNHVVWLTVGEGGRRAVPLSKVETAVRAVREGLVNGSGTQLVSVHSIWGNGNTTRGLDHVVDFRTWQSSQWCSPDVLPVRDDAYDKTRDPRQAGDWTVWEAIAHDYRREPVKPVIDAEAWYEGDGSGEGKTIFANGGALPHHVRRRAYFTVLAGAFGYTYGANGVWSKRREIPWKTALEFEGAVQMGHLGKLLASVGQGLLNMVPDQELIISGQSDDYDEHCEAARAGDGTYALVYIASGQTIEVRLDKLAGADIQARWFNPRTGDFSLPFPVPRSHKHAFDPPGESAVGNDWVLVLQAP